MVGAFKIFLNNTTDRTGSALKVIANTDTAPHGVAVGALETNKCFNFAYEFYLRANEIQLDSKPSEETLSRIRARTDEVIFADLIELGG